MKRVAASITLVASLLLPARGLHAAEGAGALRATVVDGDFGVPLAQVRVTVLGTTRGGITSEEGTLLLGEIPGGMHTLSFSKDGYERRILPDVVVTTGQVTEVRVELSQQVVDMDELVVAGVEFLSGSELSALEVRAAAVNLQDTISTELITKAGASDVAGALKLVVGASVAEGRYATVRGLSDRYTGATLNGVRVPSADPRRRAVQIDLFPTGTVEGVDVSKTFTPDQLGDATGGSVDIRTKSIPDKRTLSLSLSGEYNAGATWNDRFVTYDGGGAPASGLAGSDRERPAISDERLPSPPRPAVDPSPEALAAASAHDELVRAFTPVMGTSRAEPGLDFGAAVVGGNRWDLEGHRSIGFLGALTYSRKHDLYLDGKNAVGQVSVAGTPIEIGNRTDSKGTDEVLIGMLSNLVFRQGERHEYAFRLIANQGAEDEARFQTADKGFPLIEQNQGLHYTERTVGSAQLHGGHRLRNPLPLGRADAGNLSIDWTASYNLTRQDEPDTRYFRNDFDVESFSGQPPANTTDYLRTRRIFREISEGNVQANVNVTWPFAWGAGRRGNVKAGIYWDRSDRDYGQRSYYYSFVSQLGSSSNPAVRRNGSVGRFEGDSADDLWTDVFLEPDRIGLAPVLCGPGQTPFRASDECAAPNQLLWAILAAGIDVDYSGEQRLEAAYAMAEVPLTEALKVVGGARRESTELSIDPLNPVTGLVEIIEIQESGDRAIVRVSDTEGSAKIDDSLWLPSLSLIWAPRERMNLRFAWSRTLARPTFRELAPVATEEFLAGDEFLGNPDLTLSMIRNYDVRWEWFRRAGEVFAASLFYKDIEKPIELIGFQAGGRSFVQPVNYERGVVKGLELEARLGLGDLSEKLRPFTMGTNYALIDSKVDVPASEQASLSIVDLDEPERRLQGQPAYLFNLFADYDNVRAGTTASLFYNLTGETLLTGAAIGDFGGTPSVFSSSVPTVALTVSQRLPRNVRMSLRVANLLEDPRTTFYRTPYGATATKTERATFRTITLGAGLTW